ncbi:MAG TPA: hypothetical protein VFB30_17510 [Spirochaetia bacterium]|nr:hypothetical protein [Spirochaetia bacterium]
MVVVCAARRILVLALLVLAAAALGAQEAAQPVPAPDTTQAPEQSAAQAPAIQEPGAAQPEAPAQPPAQAPGPFGRPRFMVYLFEAEQDTLSAEERFVLYNSILAAAAEANPDVVILESPDQGVPQTKEAKEELAQRVNADSWLYVVASGGYSNLTIQAETFDILRQETFGQEIIRPGFVVDFRTISQGFWSGIVTAIRTSYSRVVDLTTLTVHGQPGSELAGIPGGPYHIDKTGTLVQKIPYPSSFQMRARASGYYDVQRPLTLGIDPLELNLGQVAKPRFGAEVRLSSFQFPGVRFWGYVLPAELFVRLGVTTQAFGLYPIDNATNVVIVGSPLSMLELDAGFFISPAENLLRFFVGAGGYLRFSGLRIDNQAAPGAITLSLGGEYSPSRRLRFVFEYEPAFILASNPQQFINLSFVANSFPSGKVPGYVMLPWGLFDLRNFYVGLRVDF